MTRESFAATAVIRDMAPASDILFPGQKVSNGSGNSILVVVDVGNVPLSGDNAANDQATPTAEPPPSTHASLCANIHLHATRTIKIDARDVAIF